MLPSGGDDAVTRVTSDHPTSDHPTNDHPTSDHPSNATSSASGQPTTTMPPAPPCSVVSVFHVRDAISRFLTSGAKLIQMELRMENYPPDFLQDRLSSVFTPSMWTRATGRQGTSLLVLEDKYDIMSLFFLSIGVYEMNITLTDSPRSCMRRVSEAAALQIFREVLLNDLKPLGPGSGMISTNGYICNMKVKDIEGYAEFGYTCCHTSPDNQVMCSDVANDQWIDLLLTLILIIKVVVVLYSPSFLPSSVFGLKFDTCEYVYTLPAPVPVVTSAEAAAAMGDAGGPSLPAPSAGKSINVVVTQKPHRYQEGSKVVHVSRLDGMKVFQTLTTSQMRPDVRYRLTYDKARLSVKARRLLGESQVPVGLLQLLYAHLLRCRIRRLTPLQACCQAELLRWPSFLTPAPGTPVRVPWLRCGRACARLLLLLLAVSPWIARVCVFFAFEDDLVRAKKDAADRHGLDIDFKGSLTLYLTPLHGFFIIIYLIVIVDAVMYAVVPPRLKDKLNFVFTKCFRDMTDKSKLQVLGWLVWLFLLPFEKLGCVGVLLFPLYALLVAPIALPLAAFYFFPALNLSVRLVLHLFLFMCPTRVTYVWNRLVDRFTVLRKTLKLHELTDQETFEHRDQFSLKGLGIQIFVIVSCLVSFWSVTFLLMEVVSFAVEMAVYTLMGIIVNAGKTLHYITVGCLTLMYGKTTLSEVQDTYLAFHKTIRKQVLNMRTADINAVAKLTSDVQDNTAFRVIGDMHATPTQPDVKLIVKNGRPMWKTSGMLIFLDRLDTPYTPEKFFHEVILLDCYGSPGPLYKQILDAIWSFGRILLFLFFVFVVVMAFGDAYKVSTTNQLLATVAGGFVPLLFRYVFAAGTKRDSLQTDGVQFKMHFHAAINSFVQNWPVHDISPNSLEEVPRNLARDSVFLSSTEARLGENPSPNSTDTRNMARPSTSSNHEPGSPTSLDLSDIMADDKGEEKDEYDPSRLDLIIDISTHTTRIRGFLENLEAAGSPSMLRRDVYNRGESARMHRPPSPLLSGVIRV